MNITGILIISDFTRYENDILKSIKWDDACKCS